MKIVGPGGQDVMDDSDGPVLVYRKFSPEWMSQSTPDVTLSRSDYYTPDGNFVG